VPPSHLDGYDRVVPLSEDEQRILQEIEQQLYASDPQLARQASTTVYRHAGRNLKWAALGFFAGLVFMVLTFASSTILGIVGFLVMLGAALAFERNLRRMGKAGWRQWTDSMRAAGMKDALGSAQRKVRERFKREDEE
jgi:hypothetical protein